jgi:hypothetical protein
MPTRVKPIIVSLLRASHLTMHTKHEEVVKLTINLCQPDPGKLNFRTTFPFIHLAEHLTEIKYLMCLVTFLEK